MSLVADLGNLGNMLAQAKILLLVICRFWGNAGLP